MKSRLIRFEDRCYTVVFLIVASIITFTLSILSFIYFEFTGITATAMTVVLFGIILTFTALAIRRPAGIHINYSEGEIVILRPRTAVIKVEISKVARIEFNEIKKERKRFKPSLLPNPYIDTEPDFVYGAGKVYYFIIHLKDGTKMGIPYCYLSSSFSKRRVIKQENKIKLALTEFSDYK